MPTDEERKQVAARLRAIDDTEWTHPRDELRALDEAIGTSQGMPYAIQATWDRLADLIEPEERTCRMTKKGPGFVLAGWWECSECGPVYPPCNDEIAVWALQKCPRCGAKVVE